MRLSSVLITLIVPIQSLSLKPEERKEVFLSSDDGCYGSYSTFIDTFNRVKTEKPDLMEGTTMHSFKKWEQALTNALLKHRAGDCREQSCNAIYGDFTIKLTEYGSRGAVDEMRKMWHYAVGQVAQGEFCTAGCDPEPQTDNVIHGLECKFD
jgi:hypothetical protein